MSIKLRRFSLIVVACIVHAWFAKVADFNDHKDFNPRLCNFG